jgi:hypothetical protein
MLVTNGDSPEDEAMLNEDSLLCLVEDVDGACDALGEYAVSAYRLFLKYPFILCLILIWPA